MHRRHFVYRNVMEIQVRLALDDDFVTLLKALFAPRGLTAEDEDLVYLRLKQAVERVEAVAMKQL